MLLAAGSLYYMNIWFWVGPRYHVPFIEVIMAFAFLGLLLLSFFPAYQNKRAGRLHTAAGILIGALMVVFALLVALAPSIEGVSPLGAEAARCFLAISAIMLISYLFSSRVRSEALVFEIVFVLTFYEFVITATFF